MPWIRFNERHRFPVCKISGNLDRCGDTPVQGVNVTVCEYESGDEVDQGETGEDGYAWFAIDAGLYDVGIDVPEGYELLTGRDNPQRGIWVASSDSVYVTFALKPQGASEEGTLSR
ncbi:MAG: hypothetical protein KOO63_12390 [Bacteroidales bacterium]|nr:hypothetical protein [Candidatus Latescibacterota bacterium]